MTFEEYEPGVWKPEKDDDEITGILINVQHDVGPMESTLYTVEVEKKPMNIWGSAILDQRMVGIKVGTMVKIVYKGLGEAKPGRNPPKIFKVLVDHDYGKGPIITSEGKYY